MNIVTEQDRTRRLGQGREIDMPPALGTRPRGPEEKKASVRHGWDSTQPKGLREGSLDAQ